MELALSKPNLRAHMEAQMKQICRGELTKDAVVADCIRRMKGIFTDVCRRAPTLDSAFTRRLSGTDFLNWSVTSASSATCSQCNQPLQLRSMAQGGGAVTRRALTCTACRLGLDLPGRGSVRPRNHQCPLCKFRVLKVTTERDMEYFICPWCYKNPPAAQLIESENFVSGHIYIGHNCIGHNCIGHNHIGHSSSLNPRTLS